MKLVCNEGERLLVAIGTRQRRRRGSPLRRLPMATRPAWVRNK